jgi:molecular chaperone DnaJ
MADKDFYEALGVARTDNEEEIRKAFRKKAMEFHPDRNKSEGAEDKFKEINEAYQVLSDPKKRAQYDRFGRAGAGSNGGQDRPFDGFDVFGGFGDIFDSFFGDASGRRENRSQRGEDLQQRVILDFNEAVFGTDREVEVTRQESCQHCSGAGNEPGSEISTCSTCRGAGQVRRSQRSVFGQFAQVVACQACRGSGKLIKTPCTSCRATGVDRRKRKISVTIPAGVEAGMQVRLTGEGDTGRDGGPAGNLYVHLDVREHEQFYREGNDLLYALPVNVAEAALGVEKEVPTLDGGTERIKVPQGTQPGAEFRIRGKGVPHLHGNNRRGDLRVLVNLQVPQALDPEQRKLLEELAISLNSSQSGNDSSGDQDGDGDGDKGIFEKIKEVLS